MDKDLRMIFNRARSRKGVTLVELVVCMALTSIFAIVCIGLINPIERMYSYSQDTGRAQLLADSIVDSLRQECENAMLDGETSVWIASRSDFGSLDDSVLIDEALNNKANEGDVLVFKRNAGFCEALYSCFPVTTQARDEIVNGEGGANRSVAALFDSEDSVKRGIVHLGYYKSAYQDDYPVPSERYDYTNPIPAATYSDFTVALTFRNMEYAESATGSKIPAFVVCDIYIFKGEYSDVKADCVYSRSTALCFTVNGSGQGVPSSDGYILPSGELEPDKVMIKVVFSKGEDEANPPPIPSFDDAHPFLAALYLNGVRGQVVPIVPNASTREGIYTFDDVDPSDIDSSNPVWVVDHYDGYSLESIRIDGTTVVVTYVPVEGKLLLGNDFNKKLGNKNNITNIIFGKKDDYIEGLLGVTSVVVSIKDSGEVYNMYIKDGTAYILSESGHFNANTSCSKMFTGLNNLQHIKGLERINFCYTTDMTSMFENCYSLEDADFGESSFPRVETMEKMFKHCHKLKRFEMLHRITASTENLHETFYACHELEYVNFEGADLSGVTNMMDMCKECTSILELDLTVCSRTPTNPINMQSIVRMCPSLTTFRAHNMTWSSMRQTFDGCTNLTTLDLENIDISQIDYLISTFNGCSSLKKIDFDVFVRNENGILDLSHVTDATQMFNGCTSLVEINGFTDVDFSSLKKIDNMFSGCSSLHDLDISGMKLPKVTSMSPMFNSISLVNLNASGAELTGITSFDSLFKNKTTLVTVDLSDVVTGRKNMSTQYMFSGCSNLERVKISSMSGFKSSNAREMFSGCKKLEHLEVNGLIGNECTSMYRMFYNCAKLQSISFGVCDVSKVTSMKEMCSGCTSLVSLDMSECKQDKSIAVDMSMIAKGCTSLETFMAENLALSNLSQAFYNCQNLSNLSLSQIDASACTNLSQAFYNCYDLTSFDFESVFTKSGDKVDLKQVTTIAQMFQNCTSLSNIGMKNVYFEDLLYFREIFSGCHSFTTLDLTGIHMPAACKEIKQFLTNDSVNTLILNDAVLELDSLKEQFKGNGQLVVFEMSNATLSNCTSVQGMFMNCSKLESVVIDGTDLSACGTAESMFQGSTVLDSVSITNTYLQACTSLSSMFKSSGIKSVVIEDNDLSLCGTCDSMFESCKKLESISMNNFKTPVCTNMNNMFRECNSVRGDIVLSGWDTHSVATMEYMFYDFGTNMSNNRTTTENVTLDISSFSFDSVTSCKEMFCVNGKSENGLSFINDYLTLVILPESANAVNLTTMYRMFSFRLNLEEIRNMGGFITSNKLINTTSTFANCRSITTIDISSMDLSGVKESKWMFNTNANTVNVLTTIYVSDDPAHAFDPSILSSGNSSNMFENCKSLVGGNDTVYDPSKLDRTYARIDGLNELPGYFSVKPAA